MKPLTAIILVWGVAYFAKVSGHLEFSWTAFALPLLVLFFLWVAFAKTITYGTEQAIKRLAKAGADARDLSR